MIYPPFTLYPHGAFMICEDTSEFDPNERPIAPESAPLEKVYAETERILPDPVEKTIGKTRGDYFTYVSPLIEALKSNEIDDPGDSDAKITELERFSEDTREMVNHLRGMVMKLRGLNSVWTESIIHEPFTAHLAKFANMKEMVARNGLETYNYTVKRMKAFNSVWGFERILHVLISNQQLLGTNFYSKELDSLFNGDNISLLQVFPDFESLLSCVYMEGDKLNRMEYDDNHQHTFTDLLRGSYECECDGIANHEDCCIECKVMQLLSFGLKLVFTESYNLQCDIVDGMMDPDLEITSARFAQRVKSLYYTRINMFVVALIMCIIDAYKLREKLKSCEAVKNYTQLLLNYKDEE